MLCEATSEDGILPIVKGFFAEETTMTHTTPNEGVGRIHSHTCFLIMKTEQSGGGYRVWGIRRSQDPR